MANHLRLAALVLWLSAALPAQSPDLTQVSLEDLLNIKVTSVSKKEQSLARAAAAIYVITQEDIRRSSATSLPDVLRLAPGVDVARVDANHWAVSIRGFSNLYSDKVLVLVDGRSVYTPTFSGVFWDQQDVPLDDIDRIEVIRGPGGTVWGANAMNGVINIITKSARETTGGLLSVTASPQGGNSLLQYGSAAGNGAYRVFGAFTGSANQTLLPGDHSPDQSGRYQAGFRSDWQLSERDSLTVQGDMAHAREDEELVVAVPSTSLDPSAARFDASNVLGRWVRSLADGGSLSLQFYFDHHNRTELGLGEIRNTTDFDFQHHLPIGSRQDFLWGAGYRVSGDRTTPGSVIWFTPARSTTSLFSAFLQDEIRLSQAVSLTVGSKFEHNTYSGFEYEPSAQLSWAMTQRQTLWFSAARAIQQPSAADTSVNIDYAMVSVPGLGNAMVRFLGTPGAQAARVYDEEIGYRATLGRRWSVDLATFLSDFPDLQGNMTGTPFVEGGNQVVLPQFYNYGARSRDFGGEAAANWAISSRWKLFASYSLLQMKVVAAPGDSQTPLLPGQNPKQQFQVRSVLNFARGWEWSATFAYTGARPSLAVPDTTRAETRLSRRIGEFTEVAVSGLNLLRPFQAEYSDAYLIRHTLEPRTVQGEIRWRF